MKYFLDTEFIENGSTIDLVSIGIVREDGENLYLQNREAKWENASDFVARHVLPQLADFDLGRRAPTCVPADHSQDRLGGACQNGALCPWRTRRGIRDSVFFFVLPSHKPEFWSYYASYDWVAFCQLFGAMVNLPKSWPMYCRDIKQWCDELGNPELPKHGDGHHALADARWNKSAWEFLSRNGNRPAQ